MIGRPRNDETAAYYFTYIDQAEGDDPLKIIENQLEPALA